MAKCESILVALFAYCSLVALTVHAHDDDDDHHHHINPVDDDHHHHDDDVSEGDGDLKQEEVEKMEYHKGSLCGYCDYCKVNNIFTGEKSRSLIKGFVPAGILPID